MTNVANIIFLWHCLEKIKQEGDRYWFSLRRMGRNCDRRCVVTFSLHEGFLTAKRAESERFTAAVSIQESLSNAKIKRKKKQVKHRTVHSFTANRNRTDHFGTRFGVIGCTMVSLLYIGITKCELPAKTSKSAGDIFHYNQSKIVSRKTKRIKMQKLKRRRCVYFGTGVVAMQIKLREREKKMKERSGVHFFFPLKLPPKVQAVSTKQSDGGFNYNTE